jgi:TonB family protein
MLLFGLGLAAAGCSEAVRPVLGGLKIGAAAGPFHMPVLDSDELPFKYPVDAWERGVGGETLLKIHIAASGWVDSVRVAKSSGHGSLDSAAVAGARLLHYRPARHGDEAVAVWGYLPVRYPMPERARHAEEDGNRR